MRLFIAIDLSKPMKDALINAQNEMYDGGMRGNYTSEENLHLTLAFIGEVPAAEPAMEALSAVTYTPFELALEGLGSFGDLWWAGMRPSPPLAALARRVRHALAEGGVPFDRKRFSPHVTLLRKARGDMLGIGIEGAGMTVEAFSLLRSDRGRNGMIYTELGRFEAN